MLKESCARNTDLSPFVSAVLEHNKLSPLTFVKDQTCLESAGEPPTLKAGRTCCEEEELERKLFRGSSDNQ